MRDDEVTAVILAGGEGRRMGGRDKGWEPVAGRPLRQVAHVPNLGSLRVAGSSGAARTIAGSSGVGGARRSGNGQARAHGGGPDADVIRGRGGADMRAVLSFLAAH